MAKFIFDSDENTRKESILTTSKNVNRLQRLEIQYPMMLKVMSDQETKEYHLKKLEQLSLKSLGEIPDIDKPNEEQKQWLRRKGVNK